MASVALSFSTEPIAGLRFPFAGYCFLLLKLCATQMFAMDRGVPFSWNLPSSQPSAPDSRPSRQASGRWTEHYCRVRNSGYLGI